MTAAARDSGAGRSSRPFLVGLLAVLIALLLTGAGGFWYLTAAGPLTLQNGGDRPIAAATLFVPAKSPLTFSLLTRPERIVAFQQAVVEPSQRQQAIREIDQLKQSLFDNTKVDYDRDIQPWVGSEITFALTDRDLDPNRAGQQPGYLTVLEIAPERQQQAREFLQLFWQRQSLVNDPPMAETVSGVRVLYAKPPSAAASALVGSQFVMFANDVRVLRRSLQVAQTAANLAQDPAYRQTVAQLPPERIALAYVNTRLAQLGKATAKDMATTEPPQFVAVGVGISTAGLVAKVRLADTASASRVASEALSEPVAALAFLPANSVIALASYDLTQLEPSLAELGLSADVLPDFLRLAADPAQELGSSSLWDWAIADYALAQVRSGTQTDWILAVLRQPEAIAQLDQAAMAQGYSVVPVAIGESEATAWTRFKARPRSQAASNSLETEVLGLHLQQGDYEIFASSVAAMESALEASLGPASLGASQSSLLASDRFAEAIAPLDAKNSGYLYADLTAILQQQSTIKAAGPLLELIKTAARPFIRHIDTFAATRDGPAASLSVQLRQAGEARQSPVR